MTSESENKDELSDFSESNCTSDDDVTGDIDQNQAKQSNTTSKSIITKTNLMSYTLIGDNIDKGVKHPYMRTDKSGLSDIHYFQYYALKDRIDLSDLSEVPNALGQDQLISMILPSAEDDAALQNNLSIIVSRILFNSLDFFKQTFDDVIDYHIKHPFYKEMSSESEIVRFIFYASLMYTGLSLLYYTRYLWELSQRVRLKLVKWWKSCPPCTNMYQP